LQLPYDRRITLTCCVCGDSAEELVPDFERIRVMLRHDGRLHWEPGGIFKTTCDIDIAYFPFDTQHCPIVIGAYSYYSVRMNITNAKSTVSPSLRYTAIQNYCMQPLYFFSNNSVKTQPPLIVFSLHILRKIDIGKKYKFVHLTCKMLGSATSNYSTIINSNFYSVTHISNVSKIFTILRQ